MDILSNEDHCPFAQTAVRYPTCPTCRVGVGDDGRRAGEKDRHCFNRVNLLKLELYKPSVARRIDALKLRKTNILVPFASYIKHFDCFTSKVFHTFTIIVFGILIQLGKAPLPCKDKCMAAKGFTESFRWTERWMVQSGAFNARNQ